MSGCAARTRCSLAVYSATQRQPVMFYYCGYYYLIWWIARPPLSPQRQNLTTTRFSEDWLRYTSVRTESKKTEKFLAVVFCGHFLLNLKAQFKIQFKFRAEVHVNNCHMYTAGHIVSCSSLNNFGLSEYPFLRHDKHFFVAEIGHVVKGQTHPSALHSASFRKCQGAMECLL